MGDSANTTAHEWSPMVMPDGKYLFFSRRRGTKWNNGGDGDTYWMETRNPGRFRFRKFPDKAK